MGYTALYRKFRPQTFGETVGQEHIKQTLKNQIISDRVGHAYLFNGGRGTGKTSVAKIMARAINCLNPQDGEPCNECEICKGALDGSLTDIVEMDAASNNSVEDVRQIREAVNFLPTKAKYRVYIIDEVHMLSIGAFNALLKTLEEPPEHVKFILATTEPQKLPATILSRCQRFDFKRIKNEDIIKRLKIVCKESQIEITDGALNLIAILAEGGMRDALSILERCNQDGTNKIDEEKIKELVGIPKITQIKELVEAIIEKNVTKAIEVTDKIIEDGKDINNLIWEIIKYIKDMLVYKVTKKADIYNKEEREELERISEKVTKEELMNLITDLSQIENEIKLSTQKLIIFQASVIKLCNGVQMQSVTENTGNAELEKRVTKIENFLRAGNFVVATKTSKEKSVKQENVETLKKESLQKPKYTGKTQDYWPKLVNEFKEKGQMLIYMNLAGTVAKEINDMTIGIEFPMGMNKLAKDVLEMPENKKKIKDSIHIASGKEMQIKYIDNKIQEVSGNEFEKFAQNIDMKYNII